MKKFTLFAYFITLGLVLTSCIKEPTACIDVPSEADVYDEVKLSNCSEDAESYEWTIEEVSISSSGKKETDDRSSDDENESQEWIQPGNYSISLEVFSKKEKKSDNTSEEIEILDICYECIYEVSGYPEYNREVEWCASDGFKNKSELMEVIQISESYGYDCSLKK